VNYELIIVRYGEIALKGKETRKRFENVLINNIKNALNTKNISNKIRNEWGRIYLYTTEIKESINVFKKIFGITSVSPATQTKSDFNSISKIARVITKEKLNNKTSFAIRVTRTGKHDFSSQDVAIHVGNEIVKTTKANVNLTKPDFELFIEIRNDNAFLFTEKIQSVCGMPYGTQGNVLAIIDSNESILASWYLMRRGCKVIYLNTKESFEDTLISFLDDWFIKTDVFLVKAGNNLLEHINKTASEKNCKAIVTGHIIKDDSQKILSNTILLKNHINIPVLQPLIAMQEEQINKKYREIGLKI
jgi:thiamine biosynthesis protein ThiI